MKVQELEISMRGKVKLSPTALRLPHSLPQAQWIKLLKKLVAAESSVQWKIGDALVFGERCYRKSYAIASQATGYDRGELHDIASVSRRVSISVRTESLSWSHHRAVAALEPHDQRKWLETAITSHLSVAALQREIQKERASQRVSKLPTGVYRVVYADVPWPIGPELFSTKYRKAQNHYPTMTLEEIRSMKLPAIADDAVLFFWATSPMLEEAFKVIRAWGFEYKTSFVWYKVRHTWGNYNSVRHELLLVATRGSCKPDNGERIDSVQTIARTEHSRKPEQFRHIIDNLYPHGQRVELFARGKLPVGWDGYGDEFIETVAAAA